MPAIFGVPKYAAALSKLADEKDCGVETTSHLVEVDGEGREAVFEDMGTGKQTTHKVSIL